MDISKIKVFELASLVNRTLRVSKFKDENEGLELIIAFDIKSGEQFLLTINHLPQEQ